MAQDMDFEKKKAELENHSEKTEQEQAKENAAPEKEEKKEDNAKKEGFWTRSWKSIKTGAKKSKRKLLKAVTKDPEDMTDEEFDGYLQDEEADGNEGYSSRYYALLEELKKMPALMQFAKDAEPKDISEAVGEDQKQENKKPETEPVKAEKETEQTEETKEPETAEVQSEEAKEPETAEVQSEETKEPETAEVQSEEAKEPETAEVQSEEAKEPEAAEVQSEENKEPEKTEEQEESTLDKLKDLKDTGVELGKDTALIYKSSKRRKAIEALEEKADPNSAQGRQLAYMKDQAKKESVSGGFHMAENVVDAVNKAIGKFGSEKLGAVAAKISKFVNMALEFGQNLAVKRLEKNSMKKGLKSLLGGSEVYDRLKDKYKVYGGTMRRAIRVAANRSSVQELVDADKDKLSAQYEENVENKDESTAAFMGLAGGRSAEAARKSMGRGTADTKEKKEEQEGK